MKSTLQNLKNKHHIVWCHPWRFRTSKSSTLTLCILSVMHRHQEWMNRMKRREIAWNELCCSKGCSGVGFRKNDFLHVPRTSKLRANHFPKIHPSPSKVPNEHRKRTFAWEGKRLQITTLHINQTINTPSHYELVPRGRANTNEKQIPRRVLTCAHRRNSIPWKAWPCAGYTATLPVRPNYDDKK